MTPHPLPLRAAPPPVPRLNRKVIIGLGAGLTLALTWALTRGLQAPQARITAEEPPVLQGQAAEMPLFLRNPLPLVSTPQVEAAVPPADTTPVAAGNPTRVSTPPRAKDIVPQPPPLAPPPSARATRPPKTEAAQSATPEPKKPSTWLIPQSKTFVATPPFPEAPTTETTRNTSALIAQAQWAQCVERTQCLYETQLIHGQIVQAINSDIPGAVSIKVTHSVTDMFGQNVTLIPQGTTLVGAQQGTPKVGQERLDFVVQRGIFPDGTVLSFAGSRLGDATGATGVEGKVNNHYVKLGIATILTAALSVGARQAGGTSSGFRSTPEEDLGRDIAGSVNQSGQDIIRRQLIQGPTITLPQGTPVVLQLKETVSLQTPPLLVRH